MKVWELIKKLEKCDPSFQVKIADLENEKALLEELDEPLVDIQAERRLVLL